MTHEEISQRWHQRHYKGGDFMVRLGYTPKGKKFTRITWTAGIKGEGTRIHIVQEHHRADVAFRHVKAEVDRVTEE